MVTSVGLELNNAFSKQIKSTGPSEDPLVPTHGYIHGHVHQHEDHMHIHGHIHNHDHRLQKVPSTRDLSGESSHCSELSVSCDDIFCGELDDCYFGDCENSRICDNLRCFARDCVNTQCNHGETCPETDEHDEVYERNKITEIECCDDPACLRNADTICDDPKCLGDQEVLDHSNNLCDTQQQRMDIFKSLLENVQKSVNRSRERVKMDDLKATKRRRLNAAQEDDCIQIHFPHRCHQPSEPEQCDTRIGYPSASNGSSSSPAKSYFSEKVSGEDIDHNTHQSCFHARIVSDRQQLDQTAMENASVNSDFDFFLQFNNFSSLFGEEPEKYEPSRTMGDTSSLVPPQSPNAPSSYSCKWENCCKRVDDTTLLDHLIDDHINDEYSLDNREMPQTQAYQCEWTNCGFSNQDFNSFLTHLSSHKSLHDENRYTNVAGVSLHSPLMTPTSIVSTFGSPRSTSVKDEKNLTNSVNITQMEIKPKRTQCCKPSGILHKCEWRVGTDENDQPVVCGKLHASDGDLQAHLQIDHIGSGRSQYECCWLGCERNGGKPFNQRQKLYRHIHIHTNYKPCKCDVCGASFAVAATLKQHMRIHSGEKPFACKHCDKKFTTSSALAIHTRVHSGEKPLKCHYPGCGKSFSESSNLAKHKRVHQKRFECEDCGLAFDKKKLYTIHRRDHLQEASEP